MRRWLAHSRTLLQALTWLLLVLYPFAVWFGVSRWGTQLLAPLLALLFTLRLLSLRGGWRQHGGLAKMLALVGIVLAVSSWLLGQSHWLLYYPVLVSLLLLALFAYSLWFPRRWSSGWRVCANRRCLPRAWLIRAGSPRFGAGSLLSTPQ
ncbi:Predicted membrane protein [Serratia rubidaea]|nr:Predicted membrane protein [Serratia rubidaea]